jgi:hypothetical protein
MAASRPGGTMYDKLENIFNMKDMWAMTLKQIKQHNMEILQKKGEPIPKTMTLNVTLAMCYAGELDGVDTAEGRRSVVEWTAKEALKYGFIGTVYGAKERVKTGIGTSLQRKNGRTTLVNSINTVRTLSGNRLTSNPKPNHSQHMVKASYEDGYVTYYEADGEDWKEVRTTSVAGLSHPRASSKSGRTHAECWPWSN